MFGQTYDLTTITDPVAATLMYDPAAEIAALQSALTQVSERYTALANEVPALKMVISRLTVERDSYAAESAQRAQERDAVMAERDRLLLQIRGLEANYAKASKDIALLTDALQAEKVKVSQAVGAATIAQGQRDQADQEAAKARADLVALKGQADRIYALLLQYYQAYSGIVAQLRLRGLIR